MRESAFIDGASEYRILFQIIIPLSKAALVSIGLFYFMGHWNSYFLPMIYLNDAKKFPLQLVLRDMLIESAVKQHSSISEDIRKLTPEAMKNATVFISMVPVLIVYPFVQKYFSSGVMLGAGMAGTKTDASAMSCRPAAIPKPIQKRGSAKMPLPG
jgi:putative aldouronate transport system permease protein